MQPTEKSDQIVAHPTNSDTMSTGAPCGACKFLRRKCVRGCVFAPYFLSEHGTDSFCAVHKVFGASNVSKLLLRIPLPEQRRDAVFSIKYEAQARLKDPIYGCVRTIFALERQVSSICYLTISISWSRIASESSIDVLCLDGLPFRGSVLPELCC